MRIRLSLIALLSFCTAAAACLWDRDTLALEARGLPGIAQIITGRFEREPPPYYESRLARVAAEIKRSPERLDLYDDAAVAADRLGRHDEAIQWMAGKRERLDAAPSPEHEYRYLANLGTFHAHRWLRSGADRANPADLVTARDLIRRAIELNPDAHFGRERYQLMAVEWLIAAPPPAEGRRHPSLLDPALESGRSYGNLEAEGLADAALGLSGLIAMGDAWESVDIFYALAVALADRNDGHLAELARLRCLELFESGKRSLHPAFPADPDFAPNLGHEVERPQYIARYFQGARAEAEAWRTGREAFMLTRLAAGMHPDTHGDFWSGFAASAPPALPHPATTGELVRRNPWKAAFLALGAIAAIVAAVIMLARIIRRRFTGPSVRSPAASNH